MADENHDWSLSGIAFADVFYWNGFGNSLNIPGQEL